MDARSWALFGGDAIDELERGGVGVGAGPDPLEDAGPTALPDALDRLEARALGAWQAGMLDAIDRAEAGACSCAGGSVGGAAWVGARSPI